MPTPPPAPAQFIPQAVLPDFQRMATCASTHLARIQSPIDRILVTLILLFFSFDERRRTFLIAALRPILPALANKMAQHLHEPAPAATTRTPRPRITMATRALWRRLRPRLRRPLPQPRLLPAPPAAARAPPPLILRGASPPDWPQASRPSLLRARPA